MNNQAMMVTGKISREDYKKKIIFLCYHNSARSQMAEGLLREMHGDDYEVFSAGIEATELDSRAVRVMNEIGIDISGQYSKTVREYRDIVFDIAVTVCDKARQNCPICSTPLEFPPDQPKPEEQPSARKVIHRSFEDPADASGSEEEQLVVFRRVRDELKDWMNSTLVS